MTLPCGHVARQRSRLASGSGPASGDREELARGSLHRRLGMLSVDLRVPPVGHTGRMAQHTKPVQLGIAVADADVLDIFYAWATPSGSRYGVPTEEQRSFALTWQTWSGGVWVQPVASGPFPPELDGRNSDPPAGLPAYRSLRLRLLDTLSGPREHVAEVAFIDAPAFRWQQAWRSVGDKERDDCTYEVFESRWLEEHKDELFHHISKYRHLKLNFPGGVLEVLCRAVLVRQPPGP